MGKPDVYTIWEFAEKAGFKGRLMPKYLLFNQFKRSRHAWLHRSIAASEAALLIGSVRILKLLSPQRSSRLLGALSAAIGSRMAQHRWVLKNLEVVFPEKNPSEIKRLGKLTWQNIGHTLGEFPHLDKMISADSKHWVDHYGLTDTTREKKPAIYFGAHIANWELSFKALSCLGIPMVGLYAPTANAAINKLAFDLRECPNGIQVDRNNASKKVLGYLKEGRSLLIYLDIKIKHGGVKVPFFERDMLTSTLAAKLAWRFDLDLVPVLNRRLRPGELISEAQPALAVEPKEGSQRAEWVSATTRLINETIEEQIRQQPGSWLCTNRRWDKSLYQQSSG